MRRRFLAVVSTATDDDCMPSTASADCSTMTSSDYSYPSSARRVPLLPEEYREVEEKEEEWRERCSSYYEPRLPSSSSSTAARFPSLRRATLLVVQLLLLAQSAAACPEGCACTRDGTHVKCEPGTFTYFPYVLPPQATHLDLSGSKLIFPEESSLDSYLPSVHTLIMRNCSLQALPANFIAEVNTLRRLDLSDNDIRDVDPDAFAGVPALEHLDLSSNRRLTLPLRAFDRLETLRTLDLSDCGLAQLEQGIFHGLEQLEELRLQNNELALLPRGLFRQQRKLRELNLSDNKIDATSALSQLPALQRLSLASNTIRYMDRLDHLTQLERLDVSRNHVVSLPSPPSFPSSLRWLDLSHNELRFLQTAAFDSLTDLKHLNLSNNKHLTDVQMNAFVSLSSLEYLSLAHCSALATLDPTAFQPIPPSLRSIHLGGITGLKCEDCRLRSFPETIQLRGHCMNEGKQHLLLASLGTCDSLQASLLIILGGIVIGLAVILVLIIVCCFRSSSSKDSRPVTPATAKHNSYGYGAHRKLKGKHSSLSPPLLASSSSSSTSPSGRDACMYEARLGAGPLGGGIIYGASGYMDWEGPVTMMSHYGRAGAGGDASSSGNSSGRSDYSEIPAYTQHQQQQNRYCVPRSTVARAFAVPAYAAGGPRLPQTPPPSMFPHAASTLYPPPKYSPPPPPQQLQQMQQHCELQQNHHQLLLQTPLALQQAAAASSIPPPSAYSPLTRL